MVSTVASVIFQRGWLAKISLELNAVILKHFLLRLSNAGPVDEKCALKTTAVYLNFLYSIPILCAVD